MATYNPAPIPESGADPRSQLDPANPGAQQNITSGLDANPSGRVAAHDQGNTAPIGSGAGGTAALAGHAQSQPAPPSQVANVDYPNVPERAEPQQGEWTRLCSSLQWHYENRYVRSISFSGITC
jgi:hypothetical protein